ncbi:hypothetical protein F5Y19DRAFT_435065 [Xylariaceae sp. FL1651]|nr:hypothetical protein F5Y19DRAFT_435065 [Xylariaceae sp. FL1651]
MAPSVLGLGIPATSPLTPRLYRGKLQKALDFMEADMNSSPYDWEMFYLEPDMDFSVIVAKLREKNWDVVMVGRGLRALDELTPFMEKIVNAVHEELPKAKIAFNTTIEKTQEACKRVLPID